MGKHNWNPYREYCGKQIMKNPELKINLQRAVVKDDTLTLYDKNGNHEQGVRRIVTRSHGRNHRALPAERIRDSLTHRT